jgi:hypothetical protein
MVKKEKTKLKKIYKIVLIGFGAFVIYSLAVVAYAMSKPAGISRTVILTTYAPWMFYILGASEP